MTGDMRHYEALVIESKKVGWPLSFTTDLTNHDYRFCTRSPPECPFVWVLRESGTHIISASADPAYYGHDENRPYLIPGYIAEAFGPDSRWYAWTGRELVSLASAEHARHFLHAEFKKNGGR